MCFEVELRRRLLSNEAIVVSTTTHVASHGTRRAGSWVSRRNHMSNRALTLAFLLSGGSAIGCGSSADAPEHHAAAASAARPAPRATPRGAVGVAGSKK
jgi:hypothetical protein